MVYINTGVILNYIISAKLFRRKCVIHVHELPVGEARHIFRFIIGFPRCKVLFNSNASRKNLDLDSRIEQFVVHNGVDLFCTDRSLNGDENERPLEILMLGRISDWKGQDLLIEALHCLPLQQLRHYRVRIVGDVFEGALFRKNLLSKIRELRLSEYARVESFERNPSTLYEECDIVVVPSRKPEPFGMVAIEAMAHGKPVIAARHGGLLEIVQENETGWFFHPNDAKDLARVLKMAETQRQRLPSLGEKGRKEFLQRFTIEHFRDAFLSAIFTASPSGRTVAPEATPAEPKHERSLRCTKEH